METTMTCKHCGYEHDALARFCPSCGVPVVADIPAAAPRAGAEPAPKVSIMGPLLIAVVIVLVVAAGGVLGWRVVSQRGASTAEAAKTQHEPAAAAAGHRGEAAPREGRGPVQAAAERTAVNDAATAPPATRKPPDAAKAKARAYARAKVKEAPAAASIADARHQQALALTREGERAFNAGNYPQAIAKAYAALDLDPGLARARQLLNESRNARQGN